MSLELSDHVLERAPAVVPAMPVSANVAMPDYLRARSELDTPFRLCVVLVPGFALMSFASIVEPMRGANRLSDRKFYDWRLLSQPGGMIESNSGIAVSTDAIDSCDPTSFDLVVVCAASRAEWQPQPQLEGFLRRMSRAGRAIAAVSTGSFLLARAGLLVDRRCTVHWDYAEAFAERFPELNLCGDLFVVDNKILTCAGATAALDMMLHIVRNHHGVDLAQQIGGQFLHCGIRAPADSQQRMLLGGGATNPIVQRAALLMQASLEEPTSVVNLMRQLGVSQRQLERLFRRYMNCTPGRYQAQLRLDRARRMLRQTDLGITEIAISCGYVSLSHFARVYRRAFGRAPREDRLAR